MGNATDRGELSPEELQREQAQELPDREAMSLVGPGLSDGVGIMPIPGEPRIEPLEPLPAPPVEGPATA